MCRPSLLKVKVLVAQSCPTLCDPVGCSPPGSSVHRIFQAKILEWIAISFSKRSSRPRDQTWISGTAGKFFTIWATGKTSLLKYTFMPWHTFCILLWAPLGLFTLYGLLILSLQLTGQYQYTTSGIILSSTFPSLTEPLEPSSSSFPSRSFHPVCLVPPHTARC